MIRFVVLPGMLVLSAILSPNVHGQNQTMPKPESKVEISDAVLDFHNGLTILDSHLDTPRLFHSNDYNFSKRGSWEKDGTHVDLPRMVDGGLDGGFWVIYTAQGVLDEKGYQAARDSALLRQTAIREFAAKYHDRVALAFSADDVERIIGQGKKVVYQSMENAYPLGTDLSLLRHFYKGGLRMIGPVHFASNQFADSSTDENQPYDGLSPLGEELVREANRLGLVVDGSHASDAATHDMIALSSTPIILSHTGADAIYDHPRNIPDDLLRELAASGGVIQMNIFGAYLEKLEPTPERLAEQERMRAELIAEYGSLDDIPRPVAQSAFATLNAKHPLPRSTYEKFMEHTFHVLKLIGPDHVGISGDWDGGGGVDGMSDVSMLYRITDDLLKAGYSKSDVEKIWGGNMIRILRAAETARTAKIESPNIIN